MNEAELLIKEAESKPRNARILHDRVEYSDAISRAYYTHAVLCESLAIQAV